eukprot:CAMPEP_0196653450 /NCGR_PEP_ID=MMETSP1086-20130531/3074_1 /TAXON_ID=77921 /ORGANISM="Cyanoptyche  gloeocystis , Strain SAG4.97" /LENGTH=361 /DNA_ID=CAMNT_0041984651 /DNA_START=54 /DNA_END=1139 /DNA_ORIENTATION=-
MSQAIGMMEGAYFVPRTELLKWLNDFFKVNYSKVEDVANGAIHCQIMDAIYPGKVPLSKVNFAAKHEYEFVKNYKVLQEVFEKQKIDRHIDVEKLIKAKYQDNLEFLQWMKRYFDLHHNAGVPYDAVERRSGALKKPSAAAAAAPHAAPAHSAPTKGAVKTITGGKTKSVSVTKDEHREHAEKENVEIAKKTTGSDAKAFPAKQLSSVKAESVVSGPAVHSSVPISAHESPSEPAVDKEMTEKVTKLTAELSSQEDKNKELTVEISELKLTVDGLEKERDFYFGKLRDIEILCQTEDSKDPDLVARIQKILYATEEPAPEEEIASLERRESGEPASAEEGEDISRPATEVLDEIVAGVTAA